MAKFTAAEYNVDLEAECLYGNDGVMWIKQAIEEAGSDDPRRYPRCSGKHRQL